MLSFEARQLFVPGKREASEYEDRAGAQGAQHAVVSRTMASGWPLARPLDARKVSKNVFDGQPMCWPWEVSVVFRKVARVDRLADQAEDTHTARHGT